MTGGDWAVIIAAVLGGGGLGGVIVNAVANRKKVAADCVATLSQAYETRINALGDRITEVENENKLLKEQQSNLLRQLDEVKSALRDSDGSNATLLKENAEFQEQIDKLSKIVNNKDKRIRELEKQVKELTERLDAMSGADGNELA